MVRRSLRVAIAGVALGVAGELAAFDWSNPARWAPDLTVGWTLIAGGLAVGSRRPRIGSLMVTTGFIWFVPNFSSLEVPFIAWVASHALYVHRGPLIHLLMSFPDGHLSSRFDRAAVAAGYAGTLLAPTAQAVGWVILVVIAVRGYLRAVGVSRRAKALALRGVITLAAAVAGGAVARSAVPLGESERISLLIYQAALCSVAVGLMVAVRRASWERVAITDLVVELAETRSGTLREALAAALGDPTLEVGYWLEEWDHYVDAFGRRMAIPDPGADRAVTPIDLEGRHLGVLIHDPAVLNDPGLLESIAAAARLASTNAQLQAEVRTQLAEVDASRRRLVEAGDHERARLERRLREGAGRRLEALAVALAQARWLARSRGRSGVPERLEVAQRRLRHTLDDLRELARGLHPSALVESGLAGALSELAAISPVPVDLRIHSGEMPEEIATAIYFVCSEALANVAKHASASACAITVRTHADRVEVQVTDDGIGGADGTLGSGLQDSRTASKPSVGR